MKDGEIVNTGPPAEVLGITDILVSTVTATEAEKSENIGEDFTPNRQAQDEEEREEGSVAISVYRKYATAVGSFLSTLILLSLLLMQGSKSLTDWWLTYWIHHENSSLQHTEAPFYSSHREMFEGEFGGWSPGQWGLTFLQIYLILGGANSGLGHIFI